MSSPKKQSVQFYSWNCLHSNTVLTLAVSCFGSGPWLGNGTEVVSASLDHTLSKETRYSCSSQLQALSSEKKPSLFWFYFAI